VLKPAIDTLVSTQTFGSNMDKPKCWVKNVIKKCTVGFKFEITFLSTFYPNLG